MPFVCSVWHAPLQQLPPAQHVPPPVAPWPQVSVRPDGHAQLPPPHVAPAAHVHPQAPQFASSVLRFTQTPLQTDSPAGQRQVPEVQVAPVAQRVPQPPQFASSVRTNAHVVGVAGGAGHVAVSAGHWQFPVTHASFVSGQTFPQDRGSTGPQFRRSLSVSTHLGFCGQYVAPTSHAHVPLEHVPSPHRIPHPPQSAGSVAYVAGSTHAPLQTSCPAGHAHVPDAQLAPAAQAIPHPPQLAMSLAYVAVSTQPPLHRCCPDGQLRSDGFGAHAASASVAATARSANGRTMAR